MSAIAESVAGAVRLLDAALQGGPLTEPALRAHIDPLFAKVLTRPGIYLANHSLGRPLDQTAQDVAHGLSLWYTALDEAWDAWLRQQTSFCTELAALTNVARADCIVPKTSAGQGLRTILNLYDRPLRVLSTQGEFDSLDIILRHYRERGRIHLQLVAPDEAGWFQTEDILAALDQPIDLLVISQVMFMSGQVITALPEIISKAHQQGARVLLDTYHGLGVIPTDLTALNVDFAVGGGYKYLRGGPGSCWLYVRPDLVATLPVSLDTGWFAKEAPFEYQRPDPPRFQVNGNRFLESTPPVLTPYQALAGLTFTRAIGITRLRAYGLQQSRLLCTALAEHGVRAEGGSDDRGAFVVIRHPQAAIWAQALCSKGISCDARGSALRLTADILTRPEEIEQAAKLVAATRLPS